jgi:hypothetical protein
VLDLWGKLFGDRGYISQKLFVQLWTGGVQMVTKLERNMKNKLLPILNKIVLRKRALIESVGEQLKHICQIEHTQHHSQVNGYVNILAALVAYTWQEHKLS